MRLHRKSGEKIEQDDRSSEIDIDIYYNQQTDISTQISSFNLHATLAQAAGHIGFHNINGQTPTQFQPMRRQKSHLQMFPQLIAFPNPLRQKIFF